MSEPTTRPALELTWFPKGNCGMSCDCEVYETGDGLGHKVENADAFARQKRLNGPELAAEFWYEASDMSPALMDRDLGELDAVGLILFRFASLPHAAEHGYE